MFRFESGETQGMVNFHKNQRKVLTKFVQFMRRPLQFVRKLSNSFEFFSTLATKLKISMVNFRGSGSEEMVNGRKSMENYIL